MPPAKYVPEELRRMAMIFLSAKQERDYRYYLLLSEISVITGLSTEQVEARIRELIR